MIDRNLAKPFESMVLGASVIVERVDMDGSGQIIAVCRRRHARQSTSLLDLTLPTPPPDGSEWIEAYRRWRTESCPSEDA